MRNSLILGLLFLAIALLAGPYVTGGQVAQWHAQQLGGLEQPVALAELPAGWRVQSSNLSRGWFSSDLSLQLLPPDSFCNTPPCELLAVESRVHHGPLALGALPSKAAMLPSLAVAVTHLDLSQLLRQTAVTPLPRARIATRVGLTGSSHSTLHVDAAEHKLNNGGQWAHEGIQGAWSQNNATLALNVKQSRYTTPNGTSLALINASYSQGLGEYALSLEKIGLSQDQPNKPEQNTQAPGLSLNGLNFNLRSDTSPAAGDQPALVNAALQASIQSLQQGQQGTGAISLKLRADRFAQGSLNKVRNSLGTIYSRGMPAQLQHLALQGLLMRELPAMSKTGPEIKLESLQIAVGDKQIDGTLDLRLSPSAEPKKTLLGFLEILDLAATISLPRQVVESAAALQASKRDPAISPADLLKEWRDKGWLIATGDNYHSNLRLADSRLTINGNESKAWADWLELQRIHQIHQEGLAGHRNWQRYLEPLDQPTAPEAANESP